MLGEKPSVHQVLSCLFAFVLGAPVYLNPNTALLEWLEVLVHRSDPTAGTRNL